MKPTTTGARFAGMMTVVALMWAAAYAARADIIPFIGGPGTGASYRADGTEQVGWRFTAAVDAPQVTQLGIWVAPANTFNGNTGALKTEHYVGLYQVTSGNTGELLAKASIPSGSTGDANDFAWAAISPVTLTAGQDYFVIADFPNAFNNTTGNDVWSPWSGNSNAATLTSAFGTRNGNGYYNNGSVLSTASVGTSVSFTEVSENGGYIGGNIGYDSPSTGDDYADWDASYPDADLSDKNGDHDGDGMSNFQEYAFGLDPTSGASVNPITDVADLKALGQFSYSRRAGSSLTYTVWTSTDLQIWDGPVAVTEDTATPSTTVNGAETVLVELNILPTEAPLFLRVKAE